MNGGTGIGRRKYTELLWERAHLAFPIAAAIAVLVCHLPILGAALETNGDNVYHLQSEYAIGRSVDAGDSVWGPQSTDFGMPTLRFYQPLFYLVNVVLHAVTGASPILLHNLSIALFFAASPLATCWSLRKIGLPRFAAAFASLLAMTSVAGFGNSFEAYHSNGIATQAMGSFFFPLFVGAFVGLLRGENRVTSTALLFAATFLSHVIMAVFAALTCALYFLVNAVPLRRVWKRVAALGALMVCLVAFWLIPFLSHTMEMRAIPDTEIRGDSKRWWFVGASDEEVVGLAVSGRLLDDARTVDRKGEGALDRLINKLNISRTHKVRAPVATALAAWGALVALFLLRRSGVRFLYAGLLFSLLLYAGQDDHPWLRFLPFIDHVQSFRCTYLIEFFAFALAGLGIERPLSLIGRALLGRRRALTCVACAVVLGIVALPTAWAFSQIGTLGTRFIATSPRGPLDEAIEAAVALPNRGYPFRVQTLERSRGMVMNWLGINGCNTGFSHWGGVGPTTMLKLHYQLHRHRKAVDLSALAGLRYLQGTAKEAAPILEPGDDAAWQLVDAGNGGRSSRRRLLFDSGREELLSPLTNPIVLVRCRHSQWIRVVDSWLTRYGARVGDPKTPIPVRVRADGWDRSAVAERASAVLVLDGDSLREDRQRLAALAARGKPVWVPFAVAGLEAKPLSPHVSLWTTLAGDVRARAAQSDQKRAPDAPGIGAEVVTVTRHDDRRRSNQRFVFDVDALDPALAFLPTNAVPGWAATLDGTPADVFSAGPDLVAVDLPQGAHRLAFTWQMPLWDKLFTILSAVTAAAVFGAWLLSALGALVLRRSLRRTLHGSRVPR